MGAFEIILGVLMILICIVIIAVILLHSSGVNGVISGAADTFISKNKARTVNAKLASMTKYITIVFFVLALLANVIALNK